MNTHAHLFRNPSDVIGYAVLHDDGETMTLVDPVAPEMVDMIRGGAHRIEVRVQFVADDELFDITEAE